MMGELAGFLVMPGIGAVLLGFGVWQLSRGLRGLGGDPNPSYDVVLRGRRTREGRLVAIRGSGAAMTFLGIVCLFLSAEGVYLALTA